MGDKRLAFVAANAEQADRLRRAYPSASVIVAEAIPTEPGASEFFLQYVPHSKRAEYVRAGWREVSGGGMGHHYCHAVLMRWDGPGEPPEMENRP